MGIVYIVSQTEDTQLPN